MFQRASQLQKQGLPSVLATITQVKGSAPREVGSKMIVSKDNIYGTIGGGSLEMLAIEQARKILLENGQQKLSVPLCSKVGQCCGGFVEIFFDIIQPKPQLYIFGAGHIGQALLETMAGTEFDCYMIDERLEWIEAAESKSRVLPNLSLATYLRKPQDFLNDKKDWNQNSFVVVMTHDHGLDQDIIETLASEDLAYLGLIGSTTKRERFIKRLTEKGVTLEQLRKLKCPVGKSFDSEIKSKVPKAVAMSIGFELLEMNMQRISKNSVQTLPTSQPVINNSVESTL